VEPAVHIAAARAVAWAADIVAAGIVVAVQVAVALPGNHQEHRPLLVQSSASRSGEHG
jgi:hypothetical protein